VFTGLLSVAFLGRTILPYMWVGIGTLSVGLIIIGLADAIFLGVNEDVNGIISGLFCCDFSPFNYIWFNCIYDMFFVFFLNMFFVVSSLWQLCWLLVEPSYCQPHTVMRCCIIRSTPKSRPNNMGLVFVRPSVCPSTKSFPIPIKFGM